MNTKLQEANRKADTLFTRWRAYECMFQYDRVGDYKTVQDAYYVYLVAEAQRQIARRDAGLPYLITPKMTEVLNEYDKCHAEHMTNDTMINAWNRIK